MSATDHVSADAANAVTRLLASYRPGSGVFDELLAPDGSVRAPWHAVLERFARLSEDERRALQDTAQRMLRDNGVTFVALDDAKSRSRPWRLDLLPMLIAPSEWQALEAGLIQRARLLNEILTDVYGAQRILDEGVLPPSVVFGNQQYLRACRHLRVRDGTYLHLIAFDVARSPDGRWWVLSDRTEAPSGAGYALENRVVSSRCLPELFATQNVRRHASFFRAFNEHLLNLSARDAPLAVFLSRGPSKRTYFEHAYLARYLGYNIVEGSDLTLRDDRLFLKTVEGLQQVDLILRTVRSDMSDPLELRGDSMIGVPGLMQAVRAGTVTVANALGSGLVESDAFLSFLPALCRYFLGEELEVPSVATWWCGQQRELDHVLDNLDDLVIRRVSSTRSLLAGGKDGRVAHDRTPEARQRLVDLVRQRGYDFVGQEVLSLSTAPVWTREQTLKPVPVVVRFYVAATDTGYQVLPGGLTRVSVESDPQAAWLAEGDISKDTWVLSDEPVDGFSLLAQRQDSGRLRRSGRDLPSRAADNLFWLGRYAERAEAAVRLLRSLVTRLHGEMGGTRDLAGSERIVGLLVAQKHLASRRGRRAMQAGRGAVEHELWSILFDPESKDGLATVLGNVRRTADVVRERLSFDAFRILVDLTNVPLLGAQSTRRETESAVRLLNRLIQHLAAFSGMVMENMTRGYGWRFLDMGRRIERVRTMSRLVQQLTVHGDPESDGALDLLLELADSAMTYRGRYLSSPQLARTLDLLMVDESNPRSMAFQLVSIETHLKVLPQSADEGMVTADKRVATRLTSDIRLLDVVDMSQTVNRNGARVRLERFARRAEQGGDDLSDRISERFFSHSVPKRLTGGGARR